MSNENKTIEEIEIEKLHAAKKAYESALRNGLSASARMVVLGNSYYSYLCALNIDNGPRTDTRNATLSNFAFAYLYAINVDKQARKDTWRAVLHSPKYKKLYEENLGRYSVLRQTTWSDEPILNEPDFVHCITKPCRRKIELD